MRLASKAFAECRGLTILTIDWGIEGDFGTADLAGAAHLLDRFLQQLGDFLVGRLSIEHLGEDHLGTRHTDQLRILVQRNAHTARLLGQRLEHGLADPPHGV